MKKLPYILIMLLLISCKEDVVTHQSESHSTALFSELPSSISGIEFSNTLDSDTTLNIFEYLYYYNGGGVGVGDFNADGREDIYFTANQRSDRLYINMGDLEFSDQTIDAGISTDSSWSSGVAVVDIDNDGDLDIYVSKVAPVSILGTHNQLYINDGAGYFSEQSDAFGLDFAGYGTQALFLDYDKDGDKDVYLINHSVHSIRSFGSSEQRSEFDNLSGDRLYESKIAQGSKKFVDVSKDADIYSSALGYGLSGAIHDFNNDGWPDIYVCNDFHENDYLYLNDMDGSFTESIGDYFSQTSKFTMGIDIADIDGDSKMDVFTTDMQPWDSRVAMRSAGEDNDKIFSIRNSLGFGAQFARNHLQLCSATNMFFDLGRYTGTYATDWSWSVLCQDFDHNGKSDLFITNGIVKRPNDLEYIKYLNTQDQMLEDGITQEEMDRVLEVMPEQPLSNILFLQEDNLEFSKVKESQVGSASFSNGSAYADLDNDGDLDLITNNINQNASILRNDSSNKNYISFSLDEPQDDLGCKVTIIGADQSYTKIQNPIRGYQSSSTQRLHFPLPVGFEIDTAFVHWPGGEERILPDLTINRNYKLTKSVGKDFLQPTIPDGGSVRHQVKTLPYIYLDNEYADYDHDKLIPEKLSSEGPALVAADFTGDGIKDIYLGGGRFSEAKLLIGNEIGSYTERDNPDFRNDIKYEDVDCAALDFDKDGDLDLYVVSGGNDVLELNELLQDRLYLNDGKGNLKRLPISLPYTNGSTVSVGDITNDGYPDLFIGARSIPNSYGLSPYSFLLENKKGFGLDIIWKKRLGMVTDSKIIDLEGDDDLDLLVAGDWMPVMIAMNKNDTLSFDNEYSSSLSKLKGLWNCIALADINKDGIQDIIAGNVGKNFKWTPSLDSPVSLSVLDIDENSSTESLIFNKFFGEQMPFHSLDKLTEQIPSLRKKYVSYIEFSKVNSISQLSQKDFIDSKLMTENRSMLFLSRDSSYEPIPLHDKLQYTSIKDALFISDRMYFLGNEDRFITDLGDTNGFSCGYSVLSYDDKIEFSDPIYLDLDHSLRTIKMDLLSEESFVFSNYKGSPVIVKNY